MKIRIVSSLGEETIQGGETIQGRKLHEEIRYPKFSRDISTIFLLQLNNLLCLAIHEVLNRNWMKIRMLLQKGLPSIVFCNITEK